MDICSQRRYNMIAIPVKTNDIKGIVSPTFGKGKYFAIVNQNGEGNVEINPSTGGVNVVTWLKEHGVKHVIVSHLGEKPFHTLVAHAIKVHFAGEERIGIEYVLEKFNHHELEEVHIQNYMKLFGHQSHDSLEEEHRGHGGGCVCSMKGTFADWLI